jgi:molybdopterin molybdotransferase
MLMIDYADALRQVTARAGPLPAEAVALTASLGRTLAQNVRALAPVPPFAKATMDGYAVRAGDTGPRTVGKPQELEVVEDLPAGRISHIAIGPCQAVRIMTGAPLPKGADAVVMVEDTEKAGTGVRILRAVNRGDNIGEAGEDLQKGELILEKGDIIGPAEVGMLASLGLASVRVTRRPKVAVIATGDEIVEPGRKAGPGRIWNANGYSLLSLARQAGAEASYLGIARDRNSQLKLKIKQARTADILVLSGGVSVGDYDLVRDELCKLGVRPVFWQLRIKPGKPTFFGVRGKQLVFGLPGNPTSAMVMFHLFTRPAIDRMLGRKRPGLRHGWAVLEEEITLRPGRMQFLRGIVSGEGPLLRVRPFADQRSGVLKSMVKSRALIIVPADSSRIEKGSEVEILLLD